MPCVCGRLAAPPAILRAHHGAAWAAPRGACGWGAHLKAPVAALIVPDRAAGVGQLGRARGRILKCHALRASTTSAQRRTGAGTHAANQTKPWCRPPAAHRPVAARPQRWQCGAALRCATHPCGRGRGVCLRRCVALAAFRRALLGRADGLADALPAAVHTEAQPLRSRAGRRSLALPGQAQRC